MKKIAVLTSGGDSPGMNAAVRAVVRTALYHDVEVAGILHGYQGMVDDHFIHMNARSVANIIQLGGTILKTSRSDEFRTHAGMQKAYNNLLANNVEGLVVIGGDGSFKGALEFSKNFNFPVIGVPGTIDNDLVGTDFAIGYDTAINTVVECVDKIRDTAESHDRLFIVEVMGRDAGLIALRSGIAVGAEGLFIPENPTTLESLLKKLHKGRKGKSSKIILVAEGDKAGGAFEVAKKIKDRYDSYDIRVTVLGHVQRGGRPTCMDRVNASRMGFAAVEALLEGRRNVMVGIINKDIAYTPLENAVKHLTSLDSGHIRMIDILSS
jgi:6-phosphofructokinase 1